MINLQFSLPQIPIFLLFCLFSQGGSAQNISLNNLLTEQIKNFEPIIRDGEVKGYCLLSYLDRAKGQNESNYRLQILDQDLHKSCEEKFTASQNLNLEMISCIGATLLLFFRNISTGTLLFKQYSFQCELLASLSLESYRDENFFLKNPDKNPSKIAPYIQPLEGKGYLLYSAFEIGKPQWHVRFINSAGILEWATPAARYEENFPVFLAANDHVIIHKTYNQFRTTNALKILDISTGKQLIDKALYLGQFEAHPISAYPADTAGRFVITSMLYDTADASPFLFSSGFFAGEMDASGQFLTYKIHLWETVMKDLVLMDTDGEIMDKGYPYLHEGIHLNDGNYYLIGECFLPYKRGIVDLNDLVLITLDKNFNFSGIHFEPKNKTYRIKGVVLDDTRIPVNIKIHKGFDYQFFQQTRMLFLFFMKFQLKTGNTLSGGNKVSYPNGLMRLAI